jgi:hypothetical protein
MNHRDGLVPRVLLVPSLLQGLKPPCGLMVPSRTDGVISILNRYLVYVFAV